MGNPVIHFEVIGKDAASLQNFYKQAFDWQSGPPMAAAGAADYAMMQTGVESGINGGIGAARDGYDGHVTFYVGVADLEVALDKIRNLGGKTLMPPEQVPNGPKIALFTDPEGHVVGLVQVDP